MSSETPAVDAEALARLGWEASSRSRASRGATPLEPWDEVHGKPQSDWLAATGAVSRAAVAPYVAALRDARVYLRNMPTNEADALLARIDALLGGQPASAAARRKRVYVAGPISNGGRNTPEEMTGTIKAALVAADRLLVARIAPFVPHLHIPWDRAYPHTHQEWLDFDFCWLSACDALLRLPGESEGADTEVEWCREHGVPVYHSVDEVIAAFRRE